MELKTDYLNALRGIIRVRLEARHMARKPSPVVEISDEDQATLGRYLILRQGEYGHQMQYWGEPTDPEDIEWQAAKELRFQKATLDVEEFEDTSFPLTAARLDYYRCELEKLPGCAYGNPKLFAELDSFLLRLASYSKRARARAQAPASDESAINERLQNLGHYPGSNRGPHYIKQPDGRLLSPDGRLLYVEAAEPTAV